MTVPTRSTRTRTKVYTGTPSELGQYPVPRFETLEQAKRYHADSLVAIRADASLQWQWAKPHAMAALDKLERQPDGRLTASPTDILKRAYCPDYLLGPATRLVMKWLDMRDDATKAVGLRPRADFVAMAASRWAPYRSEWESRLACAFDRLGVPFLYEPTRLDYRDAIGGWHVYIPDFRLTEHHMTFVEVKGRGGADGMDTWKMRLALRRHPVTLLLWDASIVEMVEDMDDPSQVVGIFDMTRFLS